MTEIKPGAFFLTTVTGPVGWAISVGQALAGDPSRWDHAGIVFDADGTVLEAEPGGARISNLSEYAGRPLLVCDGPVLSFVTEPPRSSPKMTAYADDYIRGAVVREARKLIGTPYSPADYVALAALHAHLPSAWIRRRVESSGRAICSQLVDLCYQRAGLHLYSDGRLPGDVMPADLAAWAEDWAAGNE